MKFLNKKTMPFFILNAAAIVVVVVLLFSKKEVFGNKINRDLKEGFVYTSPILDCESVQGTGSAIVPYQKIKEGVEKQSEKYGVGEYSMYFRDLNNGPWIGINEKEFFAPASLMKTPLLIGFLKNVEKHPEFLEITVTATEEDFAYALQQNFELKTKIEKGKVYTLRQVAEIMIQDSDNVAVLMLSKYIYQDDMRSLFETIGIPVRKEFFDINIRVKDFASFFRVLYNASYLNREMSELALSILVKSTFKGGIVAGVPQTVEVAHKYGERSLIQTNEGDEKIKERQLHDCGIVYTKSNPYILCIMTKGEDFQKQQEFIAAVSTLIYKEVND